MAQLLRELVVSCLTRAPMLSARAGRGRADECLLLEPCHSAVTHDRAVSDLTDPVLIRQMPVVCIGHAAGSAAIGKVSSRSNLSMSRSSLRIWGR